MCASYQKPGSNQSFTGPSAVYHPGRCRCRIIGKTDDDSFVLSKLKMRQGYRFIHAVMEHGLWKLNRDHSVAVDEKACKFVTFNIYRDDNA